MESCGKEKRLWRWYLGLAVLTAVLLLAPMLVRSMDEALGCFGYFFGSEGDWLSQHVGTAENLRQTMLESGSLFPQFTTAGGTTDIYDFAYYGLLRPDVVLSCLVPGVPMKYIVSGYVLLCMVAAVCLCFFWLRKKGLSLYSAALGGALLAAASCLFHAHHQVMFVNFLPFLILAFVGIERIVWGGSGLLLAISLLMVYLHSFYYGPVCLVACGVCFLYSWQNREAPTEAPTSVAAAAGKASARGQEKHELRRALVQLILGCTLSIGLAAVLLLPSAMAILTTSKDAGVFAGESLELVDWSFGGLLYQPYGCGLTLICLYGLVSALGDRKRRLTAVLLLIFLAVPACWLAFNGFLYAREKILIPFVPLIILLFAQLVDEVERKDRVPPRWPLVVCLLPVLYVMRREIQLASLIDFALVAAWVLCKHERRQAAVGMRVALAALLLVIPVCTSFTVNYNESWVPAGDRRQSRLSERSVTSAIVESGVKDSQNEEDVFSLYRIDTICDSLANANLLPADGLQKTAMYSSVTGSDYSRFCYPVMGNAISIRNRVALLAGENPLFNQMMGLRYLITAKAQLPKDYQVLVERDGYVLAENPGVLPTVYGTSRVLSEADHAQMEYPQNLAAMAAVPVVPEAETTVELSSLARFSPLQTAEMVNREQTVLTGRLPRTLHDEILLLTFDVERQGGAEICVTVDGVKNKLSGANAPYPNGNDHFVYLLSSGARMDTLSVEATAGDYTLENVQAWTLPRAAIRREAIVVPQNSTLGTDGKMVFCGELAMLEDGWLITSYPYRDGYTVLVDGKAREMKKVNTAFIGLPLEAGSHEIEIRYTAPGFRAGLWISLLSGVATVCWAIWCMRRKRGKIG